MEIVNIGDPPEPAVNHNRCLWNKLSKKTHLYLLNGVIFILIVLCIIFILYVCRDYLKALLIWVESQKPGVIFLIYLFLFILISFPVAIGYLMLMITSGYFFGIIKGAGTVILCANIGVAIAHYTLMSIKQYLPLKRLIKTDISKALLKVISGPSALKIVFFTRLTPLPFAIQNTIFAVGELRGFGYHIASALGLLPAQLINVYLGSTLRSMHDVLQNSHATGYAVFAAEILIGVSLMVWVITKAKTELTRMLLEAELVSSTHSIVEVTQVEQPLNEKSGELLRSKSSVTIPINPAAHDGDSSNECMEYDSAVEGAKVKEPGR